MIPNDANEYTKRILRVQIHQELPLSELDFDEGQMMNFEWAYPEATELPVILADLSQQTG